MSCQGSILKNVKECYKTLNSTTIKVSKLLDSHQEDRLHK